MTLLILIPGIGRLLFSLRHTLIFNILFSSFVVHNPSSFIYHRKFSCRWVGSHCGRCDDVVLTCCRYISEPMGNIQKSFSRVGSGYKTPSGMVTPTPRRPTPIRSMNSRASAGSMKKVVSRTATTRSNVADMFYELRLDSPGGSNSS